jgi:hypothetical protein
MKSSAARDARSSSPVRFTTLIRQIRRRMTATVAMARKIEVTVMPIGPVLSVVLKLGGAPDGFGMSGRFASCSGVKPEREAAIFAADVVCLVCLEKNGMREKKEVVVKLSA